MLRFSGRRSLCLRKTSVLSLSYPSFRALRKQMVIRWDIVTFFSNHVKEMSFQLKYNWLQKHGKLQKFWWDKIKAMFPYLEIHRRGIKRGHEDLETLTWCMYSTLYINTVEHISGGKVQKAATFDRRWRIIRPIHTKHHQKNSVERIIKSEYVMDRFRRNLLDLRPSYIPAVTIPRTTIFNCCYN